ncbi:MAG: hypothetical protein L0271_23190 [Gemmatimonadetes bacterium]|nr:hypothetical protein [Gemmatimonadota bacterium]
MTNPLRNGAIPPATLRGVYLRAGNATVRLYRVKVPDTRVDEDAHRGAHTVPLIITEPGVTSTRRSSPQPRSPAPVSISPFCP